MKFEEIKSLWNAGMTAYEIARMMGHSPASDKTVVSGDGENADIIVCGDCGREVEFVWERETGILTDVIGHRECLSLDEVAL